MRGEKKEATSKLVEFVEYITLHINAENTYLLPLYEKYISPIPAGGAVEFFIHEHHKIKRHLDEFSAKNFDLSNSADDLVSLFDKYYKFKHLLDHHHIREDTFLFRLLDRKLSEDEKKEVLKHFIFDNA